MGPKGNVLTAFVALFTIIIVFWAFETEAQKDGPVGDQRSDVRDTNFAFVMQWVLTLWCFITATR